MPPADPAPRADAADAFHAMPRAPVEEPGAAPSGAGSAVGGPPARRLRCERCLEVLSTRHAWDAATCGCGELSVTGPPWSPNVRWTASAGGGWSEVRDPDEDADPDAHADPHPDPEESPAPGRAPIGYVR